MPNSVQIKIAVKANSIQIKIAVKANVIQIYFFLKTNSNKKKKPALKATSIEIIFGTKKTSM